jgi:hypothetical protein
MATTNAAVDFLVRCAETVMDHPGCGSSGLLSHPTLVKVPPLTCPINALWKIPLSLADPSLLTLTGAARCLCPWAMPSRHSKSTSARVTQQVCERDVCFSPKRARPLSPRSFSPLRSCPQLSPPPLSPCPHTPTAPEAEAKASLLGLMREWLQEKVGVFVCAHRSFFGGGVQQPLMMSMQCLMAASGVSTKPCSFCTLDHLSATVSLCHARSPPPQTHRLPWLTACWWSTR